MATKEEIFEAIKERLSERGIETDGVTTESTLAGDLGLDSLDTVELTLGLEERFDIEIPDSDLENVETVGDAVELIEQKISVGA
ncbi:MAG TPA: acyl carrier protein [Actinomycetota bacterium]|jgi:acyl carrier protein|nr:acyl carrier protein [Actinomycetota bacterium]